MTEGMKSSEFWVSAIMPPMITILNNIFGWGIDWESLLAMFLPASTYAASRSLVKRNGYK
jgi:hypothetical protein